MSEVVIRSEHLSKFYRLGHRASYKTLRDSLTHLVSVPFQTLQNRLSGMTKQPIDDFIWALRDVSFEIKQGEVVGIIGRNGAGKSTLLKILSRITEPTEGYAEIHGRIGSLLEVGTGFHPELTGRENIYLNGAILGMKKAEITRRFDEIVAFAEVEKFLDTPVKHYSSGMYVRLAFAVAAHMEPEILLVDEVLAVGDAAFQKKCLGKMSNVAREGRTVLFVSHNMAAVDNLCRRGIVLGGGQIQFVGGQTEAIARYLASATGNTTSLRDRLDRIGSGEVRIERIEIKDVEGRVLENARSGQNVDIYLYYTIKSNRTVSRVVAGINVKTQLDMPVFLQHNRLTRESFGVLPLQGAFVCRIEKLPLSPALYRLGYSIMPDDGLTGVYFDSIADAAELNVIEGDFFGSGEVPPSTHGVCLVPATWRLEPQENFIVSSLV